MEYMSLDEKTVNHAYWWDAFEQAWIVNCDGDGDGDGDGDIDEVVALHQKMTLCRLDESSSEYSE